MERSYRLAIITLLMRENHVLTNHDLVGWFGISLRQAERDIKSVPIVIAKLDTMLTKLNNPEPVEKTYSVNEVAEILNLNPYHVRLLARSMLDHDNKTIWRFSEQELEMLKQRPNTRKRKV